MDMKEKLFTVFLGVYLLFLGHHAAHEVSLILIIGFGLAVYSHTRKGPLTPSLLLLHMGVEWIEWIHSPVIWGWLGRLGHAGMDITFFDHEIHAHRRKKTWLWGGAIFLILFVSSSFLFEIPEEILEPLHQFSLGGAIGCVGAHLWFHIFRESKVT